MTVDQNGSSLAASSVAGALPRTCSSSRSSTSRLARTKSSVRQNLDMDCHGFGAILRDMTIDFDSARMFIYANGRLLEQHVYAHLFEKASNSPAVAALLAYQNDDGGFGHGLEPDKRCPDSQPLDVAVALECLATVGANATDVVMRACDYLTTVADDRGAVPILLPSVAAYPRAAHWSGGVVPPDLNPTAAIAGHALGLGVEHPWLDKATAYCLATLENEDAPREAHTLLAVTQLLEQLGDARVGDMAAAVAAVLPGSSFFQPVPEPGNYGVTPLQFAPTPESMARAWFDDAAIGAHLDDLEAQQQDDGGWPIAWSPPSDASRCEWRAIRTLDALRTLTAYGRLGT